MAQLWLPLLKKPQSRATKLQFITGSKIYPVILTAITESARNRDRKLVGAQQQLDAGVTVRNSNRYASNPRIRQVKGYQNT
ncbi:Uncharacterized protein OBRU01_04863 [Operophtera brumata]|uniref:Uncharacterized protein n=1 Tax=Operophtera brumata TaxID=104452 RepID=A0A0L7LN16_OPEBR|nr:Uncharacterized protein OBRU01_04863 [Operophtera brumata]